MWRCVQLAVRTDSPRGALRQFVSCLLHAFRVGARGNESRKGKKPVKVIKDLFASKKFVVMLVGIIGYALSRFGFDVSAEKIEPVVAMLAAYLVGQGIADVGKPKTLEIEAPKA